MVITDMTDEIWEQLKTGNYYIKLTIIDETTSLSSNIFINSYISPETTGGNIEGFSSASITLLDSASATGLILKMKLDPNEENYLYLIFDFTIGYTPNTKGEADGQPAKVMEYLSTEELMGIGPIFFNSSYYVGIIPVVWQQGNIIEANFSSINSNYLYQAYLKLGYTSPHPITLLLELVVDGIYYSVVVKSNNTSTFTIINDDLSITVVSCKLSISSTSSLKLEFKAVKDKTDITDTFRTSLSSAIKIYAL